METVATPVALPAAGKVNIGLKVLVLVLAVAFVGVIAWNLRDTTVHEGDRAPAFSIRTDQGRTISADNFGGRCWYSTSGRAGARLALLRRLH